MDATCFGRLDHPEALKYMALKTQVKIHEDILKFARSHKFLPTGLSRIRLYTVPYWQIFVTQTVAN